MYLVFDTETTGLPKNYRAPISDVDNWPRMVQLSWQIHDEYGNFIKSEDFIIKPEGYLISFNATKIHGISSEIAQKQGVDLSYALEKFQDDLRDIKVIVGHNVEFDINVLGCEFFRKNISTKLTEIKFLDTCDERTANLCRISGGRGGKFKFPKLEELYKYLFEETLENAHNSAADVEASARCFLELIRIGHFSNDDLQVDSNYLTQFREKNPSFIQPAGISIKKYEIENIPDDNTKITFDNLKKLDNTKYSHIHNHTQFSILSATTKISDLISRAIEFKMPAVGMTDYGNLYGAFDFMNKINKVNKDSQSNILGIVGCEFFISEDYKSKKFTKENPDKKFNQVLLAKNKRGFENLSKLSSLGFIDGYYAGIPRISRELVLEYKEDLVAITGDLDSEIPWLILNRGEEIAEKSFVWWLEQFGDDFYVELLRHGLDAENHVNKILIDLAKKHNVKYIAQNNTFYENIEDAEAHDILLCIKNNEKKDTPIGIGRGFRFGFPNDNFYFKSQQEMKQLFADIPEAVENITEFLSKFQNYTLKRDIVLPKFDIPNGEFKDEDEYLKYLAYQGAEKRWGKISEEIKQRLEFELDIIKKTGYPGYFLIVQDIIKSAKEMGVLVGPGRGSAAGSVVAYCTGITNIDPIKYDLLFERFLNPERVSMPDIDIDFDDEGREKVIRWVIEKYGYNNVAQIITYGTMASKSSIRDTSRVLDYPLDQTNQLANLLPGLLKLEEIFKLNEKSLRDRAKNKYEDVKNFVEISKGNDQKAKIIEKARVLEGSVRNTGIHACGIIITPEDITNLIPVSVAKDSDLLVSQYDNSYVENAGLLKMDFLGLKNLSIIRDTCINIKKNHGIDIDIDNISLEDEKTYELFQRGDTIATFQYESEGMRKYLRDLKPNRFSDLIAMNALYRPGPLEYIPDFVKRKNGSQKITYDLDIMKEYLEETYGITVYQEQVMLLSQKIAGFTKGEADILRKAMGKKVASLLAELKPKFINGGKLNGYPENTLEKIWKDWEAFAEYAFNKSHSTCYAFIGYQTGYLKANYPSEYMASVLSKNMDNIDTISFFMGECSRMGLKILPPCINDSVDVFSVNKNGDIRFGLNAIKGVGSAAIENLIEERKNGKYKSIFDFVRRIDSRSCNKKTFEALAKAGSFDNFGHDRAQYFNVDEKENTFIETLIKYGNNVKKEQDSQQISIFGVSNEATISEPKIPYCEDWGALKKLAEEKEVLGFFVSGHPLDDYKDHFKYFINTKIEELNSNVEKFLNKTITIAGMVTNCEHRVSQKGTRWSSFSIEDFSGRYDMRIFGETYEKFKHFLDRELILFINLKITKQQNGDGYWQNINEIKLLKDVEKLQTTKLQINIPIENIDDNFFSHLGKILELKKGETKICVNISDKKNNIFLELDSHKMSIEPNIENLNILYSKDYDIKMY